jgi:hypothetical protein
MRGTMRRNLEETIITVAYGDCSIVDRIRIWWLSTRDQQVRDLLHEYSVTARSVHQIREHELPTEALHAVHTRIGRQNSARKERSFALFGLRPRLAMIVTVIAILGLGIFAAVTFLREESAPKYTQAELERTKEQVRESLAIVARVLRKTERDVDKEILTEKVSVPLNRGLLVVREYVTGG